MPKLPGGVPTLEDSMPAILDLAITDPGKAIAHLATLEQLPQDAYEYQHLFSLHYESVSSILELASREGEYFAEVRFTRTDATDFNRDPIINADIHALRGQRLRIGSAVTSISYQGRPYTERRGLQVSALKFSRTVTTAEAAEQAVAKVHVGRKIAALLAGKDALEVLQPDWPNIDVARHMGERPDLTLLPKAG